MDPTPTISPDAIRLRPTAPRPFFRERVAAMHPAYFAFVMATGIVATGAHLLGLSEVAWLLSRVNALAYPALWLLLIMRVARFPERVWADCTSHQRAPGYFTMVAATSVIGVQAVLLHDNLELGRALWWATLLLWGLTTYGILALLITRASKPSLAGGINGGWLVAVVATQSVVVLGCVAGTARTAEADLSPLVLLSFWLFGGVLYLWIISLIFYRYLFYEVSPGDLMPPYWINMGAMAISTLAGALLCMQADRSALLASMLPFVKGITVAYWATATWWIPMLLLLGLWRHGIRRFPLSYDPLYWGMVFPLGMYAVCTFRLCHVIDAPWLIPVSKLFLVAGVMAWLVTFLGLSRRILFGLVLTIRPLAPPEQAAPVAANSTDEKEIQNYGLRPHPKRT